MQKKLFMFTVILFTVIVAVTLSTVTLLAETARPDLRIRAEAVTVNKTAPKAGDTVSISVPVENIGLANATNVTMQVFAGTAKIVDKKASAILKDGKYQLTFTWKIPVTFSGMQEFRFEVDPGKIITESDETNNAALWNLSALALNVDVSIAEIPWTVTPVTTIIAGTSFKVKGQVKNIGLDPSGPIPIRAMADPLNAIPEPDENNNDKLYGLTLKVPDLILADADMHLSSNNPVRGRYITVGFTLRNTNVLAAPPAIPAFSIM